MKQYPLVSESNKITQKRTLDHKCLACESPATHEVTIQVNWFRGDDEFAFACDTHRKGAGKIELLAAWKKAGAVRQ